MSKSTIWNYLRRLGFTETATAAIMGNMQMESAFRSNNVEDRCPISDEEYTEAVDSGSYSRTDFTYDYGKAYGYGLCQWTYFSRKRALYDWLKTRGLSIADEVGQLNFLWYELHQAEYKSVLESLQSNASLGDMVYTFMRTFENPADDTSGARTRFAEAILNEFTGTMGECASGYETPEEQTPETDYWPPRTVDKTMKGQDVAVLQAVLMARGYYTAGIDSYFGDTTEEAVLTFQDNYGLTVDGIVGPKTWKKLLSM